MKYLLKDKNEQYIPAPEVPRRFLVSTRTGEAIRFLANEYAVRHPRHSFISGALLCGFKTDQYLIYDPNYNGGDLIAVPAGFGPAHDQTLKKEQKSIDTG